MITVTTLTLQFAQRILFENVSAKFVPGNCYGLIGANGAGKSTFLKILSGEIEPTSGSVTIPSGLRMSVLKQDHFAYESVKAIDVVIMGHTRMYEIMQEKEAIYAKPDFSDEDGLRSAELEEEFANLNGWEAEAQAGEILAGLGLGVEKQQAALGELDDGEKVRVLLAQALFADPDILLLDEPTNHLDVDSILWLEDFLADFKNTVIVVSHDRHFLNGVCTHIADIDYQKLQIYAGNYSFWQQASELNLRQKRDQNQKSEDKAKELKTFIARFSANASKSRQATARKKMLDKLSIEKIRPSSRKYPHVVFEPEKFHGRQVLSVDGLSKSIRGSVLFKDLSFKVMNGERIVFTSSDSLAITTLMEIITGHEEPDAGSVTWSPSARVSYAPKDNARFFEAELDLVEWLRQYATDNSEEFIRSFLGRMLFSGEESKKKVQVLSGGEKVRCVFSKLMLENPSCLVLDGPTNHLDLESITSVNRSLMKYPGTLLFASHDVAFIQSLATRVVEVTSSGLLDHPISYAEYLEARGEARRAS